eukprot:scaffold5893_cov106-Skeletonema_marinoi.AAC.6
MYNSLTIGVEKILLIPRSLGFWSAQRMHVGIVKRVGVKVVTFAIIANSAVKVVAAWIALARRRRE